MRTGLLVSVFGHAVLLLWGIISLPSPNPLDLSNLEAVPVDLVSLDELTKLNLGITTAEAREETVPEPPAPTIAEVPPEPTPKPEPLPPEPAVAEPEPPPLPPEPEPKPVVAEDPEPPPPEERVAEPDPPPPVPRPRPKPPKIVVARAETEQNFNADEISALLDRSKPTGSTTPVETPPTLGNASGSPTESMTVNELDALRARLAQCWNIQLAPPDLSELRVKLKLFLNEDGSLAQSPQVLEVGSSDFARSAAESALRAVRRCAPYNLPPQKYDQWREINVTFDPREMFGG